MATIHADKIYRTSDKFGPRREYVVIYHNGERIVVTLPEAESAVRSGEAKSVKRI